ncbi:hypothetical protein BDW71DRAFT_177619 [Aspergillus fruticulosus]
MTGHRSCVQMLALSRWDCSYSQTLSCTRQGSRKPIQNARHAISNSNFDVSRQPRVRWFGPCSALLPWTQRCISPAPAGKGGRMKYVCSC